MNFFWWASNVDYYKWMRLTLTLSSRFLAAQTSAVLPPITSTSRSVWPLCLPYRRACISPGRPTASARLAPSSGGTSPPRGPWTERSPRAGRSDRPAGWWTLGWTAHRDGSWTCAGSARPAGRLRSPAKDCTRDQREPPSTLLTRSGRLNTPNTHTLNASLKWDL